MLRVVMVGLPRILVWNPVAGSSGQSWAMSFRGKWPVFTFCLLLLCDLSKVLSISGPVFSSIKWDNLVPFFWVDRRIKQLSCVVLHTWHMVSVQ